MLNLGQASYIRYEISHPVQLAILALRVGFAFVDSDLLCDARRRVLAKELPEPWERAHF
jgi:hypothetical protein